MYFCNEFKGILNISTYYSKGHINYKNQLDVVWILKRRGWGVLCLWADIVVHTQECADDLEVRECYFSTFLIYVVIHVVFLVLPLFGSYIWVVRVRPKMKSILLHYNCLQSLKKSISEWNSANFYRHHCWLHSQPRHTCKVLLWHKGFFLCD